MSRTTVADLDEANAAAAEAETRYLREHGWTHTCSTPGAYWLWERRLADGRTVLCDRTLAVRISQHLDLREAVKIPHEFGEDAVCIHCDISADDFERGGFTAPCTDPLDED